MTKKHLKIQPLCDENPQRTINKSKFFNLIKHTFEEPTADIIHNEERWNVFSLRWVNQERILSLTNFLPYCAGGHSAVRQG